MIETFLNLVRQGIMHQGCVLKQVKDWNALDELAARQGLSAIVVDGIERLPKNYRPPQQILLNWIGNVLQNYEQRYIAYENAIRSLAAFYNHHRFKMMVLKGYACSLDWPKPEHRPCGDIDIWLFGQWREADNALATEKGVKIDGAHHHHTVFEWGGFMVENHYDFVNVYAHKSSRELEKVFKELVQDDSHWVEINGEKVYIPSPNLHALFLICHMATHFAFSEITLRQILDWAFFVEKHTKNTDWEWLDGKLVKFHMKDFVNSINGICVEDLGFHSSSFYHLQFNPVIKDRVLKDILSPSLAVKNLVMYLKELFLSIAAGRLMPGNRNCVMMKADGALFGMEFGIIC